MNKSDILNELKNKLNNRHQLKKIKINDLKILIEGYSHNSYSEVKKTKLYNDEGGLYCYLLEVLNNIYNNSDVNI